MTFDVLRVRRICSAAFLLYIRDELKNFTVILGIALIRAGESLPRSSSESFSIKSFDEEIQ